MLRESFLLSTVPVLPRQDAGASHNPVACGFSAFLLLSPGGTFPSTSASHGPLRHYRRGRSRLFFETFPKSPCHLPQTHSDLPHGIQLWRHSEPLLPGKVRHPFGEGLLFPGGPSPAHRPPTALCVTFGGEGHSTFLRPSPNHIDTFPKRTRTFPTESSSGA